MADPLANGQPPLSHPAVNAKDKMMSLGWSSALLNPRLLNIPHVYNMCPPLMSCHRQQAALWVPDLAGQLEPPRCALPQDVGHGVRTCDLLSPYTKSHRLVQRTAYQSQDGGRARDTLGWLLLSHRSQLVAQGNRYTALL